MPASSPPVASPRGPGRGARVAFLGASLLAAGAALAGPPSPRATYDALAKRARADDRTVDVPALRRAAGAAGVASPPGSRERLAAAARKGDARGLAREASAVVARNEVDLWAHHYAAKAAATLGDARAEDHHLWLLSALVDALTATGDGQSPDTPMVVISDDEPAFLVQALHAELEEQRSGTCKGDPCDLIAVRHRDGSRATWYFDVSIPRARPASAGK